MAQTQQRTNLILLAILALLGAGAAIKAFMVKGDFETDDTAKASEALFSSFKKDDVSTLVIDGPEEKKAELQKDGDHWNVVTENNARADKADVDKVLNGIEKLRCGKVASQKGDQLDSFNLQKGKGITVKAYGAGGKSGAPVAEFTIGKNSEDWKFAFLKLPKENSIRKVDGATTSDFDQGYDNTWRDKSILDEGDAAKIEQIEITGPKGAVVLVRGKEEGPKDAPAPKSDASAGGDAAGGDASKGEASKGDAVNAAAKPDKEVKEQYWELEQPTKARAKKWLGDNAATNLAKLECDSFFTGTEKPADLGLEPPAFVARVKREGDADWKAILLIGNKSKDGKYPVMLGKDAKNGKDPTIFWLASWKGDYLTKSADELLETPPPKTDEKKPDEKKTDEKKAEENKPDATKADPAAAEKGDGKAAPAPANPPADEKKGDEKKPDAKPNDGGKPADGAKPGDGGKPNDGSKPDGGAKPGDPAKPADGSKPNDGAKPSDGSKPDGGGGH